MSKNNSKEGNQNKTPMQLQYERIKKEYSDAILFFRLGDFYEMFGEDAVIAADILGIVLTARKNKSGSQKMCGIPFHSSENYINKLVDSGYKVAVCEQVSDPSNKGIVEREVTNIITPATNLSVKTESSKSMLSFKVTTSGVDFLVCNISTLKLTYGTVLKTSDLSEIMDKFNVSEVVGLSEKCSEMDRLIEEKSIHFKRMNLSECERILESELQLLKLENKFADVFCLIKQYIQIHLGQFVRSFSEASSYNSSKKFIMPFKSLANLEVFYNFDGSKKNSLFSHINYCKTNMGASLLVERLCSPYSHKKYIDQALDQVQGFLESDELEEIGSLLGEIKNIPRLVARIDSLKATPADLVTLKMSIENAIKASKIMTVSKIFGEYNFETKLSKTLNLLDLLIEQDPRVVLSKGYIFKSESNSELASKRHMLENSQGLMDSMLEKLKESTGIVNMKIKHNKVFGFFIEVSKAKTENVPEHFIRRQTLINCERYTTLELQEFETEITSAESKMVELEQKMFLELLKNLSVELRMILECSEFIAKIDLTQSLANLAKNQNFCRPSVFQNNEFIVDGGFHPVIVNLLKYGEFIENDLDLSKEKFQILTGPNMGGKSTFLRQNAIIMLLCSIGSFVPAKSAKLGVCDGIYTRVGASDNLSKGQSTFMVEMEETSQILKNATNKSFVIIDELGRGTCSSDGIAIAESVVNYMVKHVQCRTLFATHFFEIATNNIENEFIGNLKVAVEYDQNNKPVFLRKIVPGMVDKSYGIEVAEMAGMPLEIIENSRLYLEQSETDKSCENQKRDTERVAAPDSDVINEIFLDKGELVLEDTKSRSQRSLFASDESALINVKSDESAKLKQYKKLIREIEGININGITPIESIIKLSEIHSKALRIKKLK